jgi:phosphohistidine phosphatase
MSLQLNIMRHAKSSWGDPGMGDRERGLNSRGRRDAPRMGEALAARMPAPAVFVSPARRAQMTLEGLIQGWPVLAEREHRTVEELYTFSLTELLNWFSQQDAAGDSLFVLGHNPGLTDLVNYLCGIPVIDNLPTAGFAALIVHADSWSAMTPGSASIESHLFPKELGDA